MWHKLLIGFVWNNYFSYLSHKGKDWEEKKDWTSVNASPVWHVNVSFLTNAFTDEIYKTFLKKMTYAIVEMCIEEQFVCVFS